MNTLDKRMAPRGWHPKGPTWSIEELHLKQEQGWECGSVVEQEPSETCRRPWAPSYGQQKQSRLNRRGWICGVCSSGEDRQTGAAGRSQGKPMCSLNPDKAR